MRIDSSGKVGIGTDNPSSALHIIGVRDNNPAKEGIHMGSYYGTNNLVNYGIEIVSNLSTGSGETGYGSIDFSSKENIHNSNSGGGSYLILMEV